MVRLPPLPAPLLRTLLDLATQEDAEDPAVIEATFFEPSLEDLWCEHRHTLLAAWVEEHPGTRPSMWWRFDAPGAPLAHRTVLGGSGRVLAIGPIGGLPFFTAVNRAAPPLLESEPAFLDRLGLLLPGEARRLRPEDFVPEELEDGEP